MHLDNIGVTLLVLSFVSFFVLMIRGFVLGDVLRVSDSMFFFIGGLCLFFIEVLFVNDRIILAAGAGICLIAVAAVGFAVRTVFVSKAGVKADVPHRSHAGRAARARARIQRDLVRTESALLALSLDRETHELFGDVVDGSLKGRSLASLRPAEYAMLRRECERRDPEGLELLTAWIERQGMSEAQATAAPMPERACPTQLVHSRHEAFNVLGLQPSADAGSVQSAYQTLKSRLDPRDSAYLTKMLDEAYQILMQAGQEAKQAMGGNSVAYR